jgi:ankyrin repeat protein
MSVLDEIREGRTDLVFEYVAQGNSAHAKDADGVTLLQWCAYYGDVSAMKFLLANGATRGSLGENLGLTAACFHGHWRLCKFLIERGADVNRPEEETGESPLHSVLCTSERLRRNVVLKVLLAHGANPNCVTRPNVETGAFMRDCRTKGETPLHRAAAFGDEEAIQLLLDAGAIIDAKDMNGDTPLSWASWYSRPIPILRKLLYGNFRIHPNYGGGMEANLVGKPLLPEMS